MAKQNFTTGQVLTAAQMLSLQQTAMLGGSAAVKTTNYVLVSGDAGTQIALNATSTTTVTVNTGIFSTGDTITIVNQNTGAAVITAGTATVRKATNASLTLSQYQGGVLDFVSASEAIFFPFDVGSSGSTSNLNFQEFTSSGTFNVPAGVTNVLVFAVGGGGGGGGATTSTNGRQFCGGGGGGGDVVFQPVAVTGGSAVTVTIGSAGTAGVAANGNGGTGGNTTFGSLLTACGGGGGGGAGGSASSGNSVTSPNRSRGGGGGAGAAGDATNINGVGAGGGGATSRGTDARIVSVSTPANLIYTTPAGGGDKGGGRSIVARTLQAGGNFTTMGGYGGEGFMGYGSGGGGGSEVTGGFAGSNASDGASGGNNGAGNATANYGGGGGGSCSQSTTVANAGGAGGSGFLRVTWVA